MSAKKTDISQISKYLKEELDARAMHVLEKEAQNDPFLMDAMEGFESAKTDPQSTMPDLTKRLEQRIDQKQKRLIPWRTMAVAASVLLFLSVGGFLIFHRQADQAPPLIAHIDKTPVAKQTDTVVSVKPVPAAPTIAAVIKHEQKKSATHPVTVTETSPPASSEIADNANYSADNSNSGYYNKAASVNANQRSLLANARKADTTTSLTYKKAESTQYALAVGSLQPLKEQTLLGKVKGASIIKPEHKATPQQELAITGRINDKLFPDNGVQPVPGANAVSKGKSIFIETDSTRYMTSSAAKKSQSENFSGFLKQQQKAADKDSTENKQALSEVTVIDYGTVRKMTKVIAEAHPMSGWDEFNKYLKQNAVTDQKTGIVRISFLVSSDGSISDFNVVKSLDETADKKAVDLIKAGSKWLGNADGKPEIVELKIRFGKAAMVK